MSYTDDSFYGDLLTDEYSIEQDTIMNPETPFGFFIYKIIGGGFDKISEDITDFRNNCNVLSCDVKYLPIYGRYYDLSRPTVNGHTLTDEEYRVYLYLKNCQLLTIQNLRICFNKCMGFEEYDVYVNIEESNVDNLTVVDHENYTGTSDNTSNLKPNADDDLVNIVVKNGSTSDVNTFRGYTGHTYNQIVTVEVPFNNWSSEFLGLLETFISIKGNVFIEEYNL